MGGRSNGESEEGSNSPPHVGPEESRHDKCVLVSSRYGIIRTVLSVKVIESTTDSEEEEKRVLYLFIISISEKSLHSNAYTVRYAVLFGYYTTQLRKRVEMVESGMVCIRIFRFVNPPRELTGNAVSNAESS